MMKIFHYFLAKNLRSQSPQNGQMCSLGKSRRITEDCGHGLEANSEAVDDWDDLHDQMDQMIEDDTKRHAL